MFKTACKHNEEVIFYFDIWGNKHVATGGTLAWRLRNPGLVHKGTHAAVRNGSIGSCDNFAIFAEPEYGQKALTDWLNSKMCQNATLESIVKYYRPKNSDSFLGYIIAAVGVSQTKKIRDLSKQELQNLQNAICKLCGYTYIGDENFALLPKITAKIENCVSNEEFYLISNNMILSKNEAVQWVLRHQLDAIVVHEKNDENRVHLRSRPLHCMQHIRLNKHSFLLSEDQIKTICRSVGVKKSGQCIWAFINGISNTRESALESATLISNAASGEQVLSMPNDQNLWGFWNFIPAIIQKGSFDTSAVELAVKFFHYLIDLSNQDPEHPPIIIFVHSQGAIIAEHALEHLKIDERKRLRIFSFGGGSFINPNKCHPDSHNYASASDPITRATSYSFQDAGLFYYYLARKGKTHEQIIELLIERDVMLFSDSVNFLKPKIWFEARKKYYEEIFDMHISIVPPDHFIEHEFKNNCYQMIIKDIIKKYRIK